MHRRLAPNQSGNQASEISSERWEWGKHKGRVVKVCQLGVPRILFIFVGLFVQSWMFDHVWTIIYTYIRIYYVFDVKTCFCKPWRCDSYLIMFKIGPCRPMDFGCLAILVSMLVAFRDAVYVLLEPCVWDDLSCLVTPTLSARYVIKVSLS